MPKLVTWMNNQRVGELTKLANGAHTFKYAPEWLASRYARPLSLSLPLQRGNITSDAVFNFFDNLLPDSPIVRDRIVKRYLRHHFSISGPWRYGNTHQRSQTGNGA